MNTHDINKLFWNSTKIEMLLFRQPYNPDNMWDMHTGLRMTTV